jgi:hypothetical protein
MSLCSPHAGRGASWYLRRSMAFEGRGAGQSTGQCYYCGNIPLLREIRIPYKHHPARSHILFPRL